MIPAVNAWRSNADLIADVAALGYITGDVLDCTYGEGVFWRQWRPEFLLACDADIKKSPYGQAIDFRRMPWGGNRFQTVVFDPPFKLNGTPTVKLDKRYGVHEKSSWQARMQLMYAGLRECARVTDVGGHLLAKCQDQVCSGKVRWQTYEMINHGLSYGLELVDRFDMIGTSRPQPGTRTQRHAHGRPSTLLVFEQRTHHMKRSTP